MWESLLLLLFFVIITLVFYRILVTTKNILIFVSVLFAFYIVFRYVLTSVQYQVKDSELPVVTENDLKKYSLEQGVELREYQEDFVNQENYDDDTDEDDDVV